MDCRNTSPPYYQFKNSEGLPPMNTLQKHHSLIDVRPQKLTVFAGNSTAKAEFKHSRRSMEDLTTRSQNFPSATPTSAKTIQSKVMHAPKLFIKRLKNGQLEIVQKTAEMLKEINSSVASVIAVTGTYRTGKSFLLNRLAGSNTGFSMGASIESTTKGIWIWVVPHPRYSGKSMILMDTEGMSDADKGDLEQDNTIFTLATLLSSLLVYNILGCIDEDKMAKLYFIMEATQRIKGHASMTESGSISDYFPTFVILVRDFALVLEAEGKPITPDQYMENLLSTTKGDDVKYCATRSCIKNYFTKRRCFTLDRPGTRKQLANMEYTRYEELSLDFQHEMKKFTDYAFMHKQSNFKKGRIDLTSQSFLQLAYCYVDNMNDGAVPYIQKAYSTIIRARNEEIFKKCFEMYQKEMKKQFTLPSPDKDSLDRVHSEAKSKATAQLSENIDHSVHSLFMKGLRGEIDQYYKKEKHEHNELSQKKCEEALARLERPILDLCNRGHYFGKDGLRKYDDDVNTMTAEFRAMNDLGVMKDNVLHKFLDSRKGMRMSIETSCARLQGEVPHHAFHNCHGYDAREPRGMEHGRDYSHNYYGPMSGQASGYSHQSDQSYSMSDDSLHNTPNHDVSSLARQMAEEKNKVEHDMAALRDELKTKQDKKTSKRKFKQCLTQ